MEQMGDKADELATQAEAGLSRSTEGRPGAPPAGADGKTVEGRARGQVAAAAGPNIFAGRWSA